jgi:hypothetical protein
VRAKPGGILFLNDETFPSATLTTFDGNDYFILGIETTGVEIR